MALSDIIYNLLLELRKTTGKKAKARLLSSHRNSPTFKRILYQTYSPYIRYHIRKLGRAYNGRGRNELGQDTWTLLNQLSLRKITGNVARETLMEHMEALTPSAAEILRLVVQKDLKCGIATKTINNIFTGLIPTFDCQLVDDWDDSKAKYPMMVGPKVDCVRGEFRDGQFYTRNGHKVTGIDHIIRYIQSVGKHMELSGELYIPGMRFARAAGIIKSNKAKKLNVRFAIFDIPSFRGMPYDNRHEYLYKTFFPLGTKPIPEAVYIPHIMVDSKEEALKYFNAWVKMGYEGLVGKNPNGFVLIGKGSYDWMRLVNGISVERKVIGVYESEEKPGFLGGVIIEGNTRVGSGFEEDERIKYLRDPSLVVGKYATIIAKEVTKAGSLRQPIWKGIRTDI